jgi:hypothetical protein
MIRQLFNLQLSRKELGALLNIMDMPKSLDINCSEFLRQFLAIGIDKREKERVAARKKQELFEKKLEQEEMLKLQQKEERGNFSIDYDFSEFDIARAMAKLTEASTHYDRSLPGCQSLDCFEVHHLGPGAFRDALRRTFMLHFTDKEMGMYNGIFVGLLLSWKLLLLFLSTIQVRWFASLTKRTRAM